MATDEDDGMISRWSKRKRGLEVEPEEEIVLSEEEQAVIDEEIDAELLANREAAEEIDLETIDEESDLSIFMKKGVPEALKKQALALLWRSNPIFANVDGLNDYDENFGDKSLNMKVFKSAWQAGRGYLKKIEEEVEEELEGVDVAEAVLKDKPETEDDTEDEEAVLDEDQEEALASNEEGNAPEDIAEEDVQHAAYEIDEEPLEEEMPMPKISLRQRLALDS